MKIVLPIEPTAQKRARVGRNKWSGKALAFKSTQQRHNEYDIMSLLTDYIPEETIEGPIKLSFIAYMPITKTDRKSKKKTLAMMNGEIPHIKKPDIDNLAKNLLDCMTKLSFWYDDTQITELIAKKRYDDGDNPRWEIEITKL